MGPSFFARFAVLHKRNSAESGFTCAAARAVSLPLRCTTSKPRANYPPPHGPGRVLCVAQPQHRGVRPTSSAPRSVARSEPHGDARVKY